MNPKKVENTGSDVIKIPNIAFPVYTSGYYGQTAGDMNKSHKQTFPQVGVGLCDEPKTRARSPWQEASSRHRYPVFKE